MYSVPMFPIAFVRVILLLYNKQQHVRAQEVISTLHFLQLLIDFLLPMYSSTSKCYLANTRAQWKRPLRLEVPRGHDICRHDTSHRVLRVALGFEEVFLGVANVPLLQKHIGIIHNSTVAAEHHSEPKLMWARSNLRLI
jgi:hypothetical protein